MRFSILLLVFMAILALALMPHLLAQGKKAVSRTGSASLAYNPFETYAVAPEEDLGVFWSETRTTCKIWSPAAQAMKLRLYRTSTGNDLIGEFRCRKDARGVFTVILEGNFKDRYYTVQAKIKGKWGDEGPDPYANAVGVNGLRGQIIDLNETDPPGWDQDRSPEFGNPSDAVLYELHVRDFSVAPNSGMKNKGKFLAFTESGTRNSHGQTTGIDHIAEMGVTHVHLLPSFDFCSIDESKPEIPQYNWGYDPQNYNVPEGSYSSNPDDGKVRIREFKELVQSMHRQGLRVVMDVVYNHTGLTAGSRFEQLVPGYYYRQWPSDGAYSNASACGNETASDRTMVRKFILESVQYWVREYHIDGFRFDLMAIHDLETMNLIASTLREMDPTILVYGEGWTAGDSPLPENHRALKKYAMKMKEIAVFSDDIRDGIKGSVFDEKSTGFASGNKEMAESVKFGIVAAGFHPQIDYARVNYSKEPYTTNPGSVINYVSCHDNQTLYDKLKVSRPDADEATLLKMHKLANTIVLTSQGIPFLHAGVEMKRTKGGEHNSFNKPDSVNRINWDWKYDNRELVDFYQQMIRLRKSHPAFRMTTGEMIRAHLTFLPVKDTQLIAYVIGNHANHDPWSQILVVLNGSEELKQVDVPNGNWKVALMNHQFPGETPTVSGSLAIQPVSAAILYQE